MAIQRVAGLVMKYFSHEQAIVESSKVGDGTRIWANVHILPGATIGNDCNICDAVFIENDVVIGDRVTIKCGVQLWDGICVEDDVFIGPNATFANDPFPRSRKPPSQFLRTNIKIGASIGANATILPGITIGRESMIGAGAVVTRDVPPYAIVAGNPARIIGYTHAASSQPSGPIRAAELPSRAQLNVSSVEVFELPVHRDLRGAVAVAQHPDFLPFQPKRCFFVFDVPSKYVRGEHAHRALHQFIVCVSGSCTIMVDDGHCRAEVILDTPSRGLYLPPMVWEVQYNFSANGVLAVMASDDYEPGDYIRDYDEFMKSVA